MEQRVCEEDATASQGASEEVIGGEETGGVHGVAERDVDEDALHDDEDRGSIDGDADGRDDPVNRGARGPGEEEQTDCWAECRRKGGDEAALLDAETVLDKTRVGVVVEVADVDTDTNHAGDEDAEENETNLAKVHAIVDRVDQGENLEEGVVDTIDDSSVDLNEQHSRVLEGNLEGLDEGLEEDAGDLHVALVDFALGHEAIAAGDLAQATGTLEEDSVAAGLGEEEEHEDEDWSGGPDGDVEGPAPAFDGNGKAGEEGTESSWRNLSAMVAVKIVEE